MSTDTLRERYETPIDVWFRFYEDDEEETEYEANTFHTPDDRYRVDWYHNDVGQVVSVLFDTYEDAVKWYMIHGYEDFSS